MEVAELKAALKKAAGAKEAAIKAAALKTAGEVGAAEAAAEAATLAGVAAAAQAAEAEAVQVAEVQAAEAAEAAEDAEEGAEAEVAGTPPPPWDPDVMTAWHQGRCDADMPRLVLDADTKCSLSYADIAALMGHPAQGAWRSAAAKALKENINVWLAAEPFKLAPEMNPRTHRWSFAGIRSNGTVE